MSRYLIQIVYNNFKKFKLKFIRKNKNSFSMINNWSFKKNANKNRSNYPVVSILERIIPINLIYLYQTYKILQQLMYYQLPSSSYSFSVVNKTIIHNISFFQKLFNLLFQGIIEYQMTFLQHKQTFSPSKRVMHCRKHFLNLWLTFTNWFQNILIPLISFPIYTII